MTERITHDEWTAMIVRNPATRQREFRRAAATEVVWSIAAAAFAIVAVWALLGDARIPGGVDPRAAGALAVLCFTACMALASGGGMKKRVISLVGALEAHRTHTGSTKGAS